jgi:hypothetical protein
MKKVSLIVMGLLLCSAIYAQGWGESKATLTDQAPDTNTENCKTVKAEKANVTKCTAVTTSKANTTQTTTKPQPVKTTVTYTVCDKNKPNQCYKFSDEILGRYGE